MPNDAPEPTGSGGWIKGVSELLVALVAGAGTTIGLYWGSISRLDKLSYPVSLTACEVRCAPKAPGWTSMRYIIANPSPKGSDSFEVVLTFDHGVRWVKDLTPPPEQPTFAQGGQKTPQAGDPSGQSTGTPSGQAAMQEADEWVRDLQEFGAVLKPKQKDQQLCPFRTITFVVSIKDAQPNALVAKLSNLVNGKAPDICPGSIQDVLLTQMEATYLFNEKMEIIVSVVGGILVLAIAWLVILALRQRKRSKDWPEPLVRARGAETSGGREEKEALPVTREALNEEIEKLRKEFGGKQRIV